MDAMERWFFDIMDVVRLTWTCPLLRRCARVPHALSREHAVYMVRFNAYLRHINDLDGSSTDDEWRERVSSVA